MSAEPRTLKLGPFYRVALSNLPGRQGQRLDEELRLAPFEAVILETLRIRW
jgi:hypothetical protein